MKTSMCSPGAARGEGSRQEDLARPGVRTIGLGIALCLPIAILGCRGWQVAPGVSDPRGFGKSDYLVMGGVDAWRPPSSAASGVEIDRGSAFDRQGSLALDASRISHYARENLLPPSVVGPGLGGGDRVALHRESRATPEFDSKPLAPLTRLDSRQMWSYTVTGGGVEPFDMWRNTAATLISMGE